MSVIAFATCGKDSPTKPKPPEPPPPPVSPVATRIEITPPSATLNSIGQTVRLTARVFDQNNNAMASATVTWSSSDVSVAGVNAQGLVTAVMSGTVVITARSGSANATVNITVSQTAGSIVIEPMEATLMSLGATVQLSVTVLDGNGQPVSGAVVTWQSSDDAVATVSVQGLVTAVRNGTVRITARSGTASAGIDVSVMQSAGSIMIAPEEATLMSIGETVQLTATVLDGNGQPVVGAVVDWQSSDEAVATVSAQGLVTAVTNGVARITATSGSASSGVDVTVMQSAGSIVIEPMEATLMSLGETVQLESTVLDGNGQPVAGAVVIWQSSDEAVATVSTDGLVTAVMNGTARIMATSGTATAGIDVTVMQSAGSIVIEPEEATLMAIGETVQLTATVLDGNGQPVEGAVVTWQSSDESVATVSAQGLVTAVRNGVTRIWATSGSAMSSISLKIMQTAGSIVIEPLEATLISFGETVQLTATVLDGNGQPVEGAVVTWHSSDEAVATVSAQGLVTAVSNGVSRITATSGSTSSGIDVTVLQSAGSIVIEPEEATLMSIGATVQLVATVLDGNGQPVEGAVVTWQSSDESVATVSVQGLVTALMNGTARVTATSGSASAGIDVTVMQSAGSIVIAPDEATLMSLGETVQLTAAVLDQNGQPVDGAVVRWSSGDESVATVSSQGLVTAVGNGVARITATSGSASSGIDVTVMQIAGSIVIAPMEATLMSLGATVQLTATVLDGNGQPVAGAVVTWTSSDESVATVSAQGVVTAVGNGVARITATSGGASSGIDVSVMQSAGSIVIAPEEATLMSLGETVQLTAAVVDQNGQPVEGAVVTWQSSDEAIATVSAQGLVTAVNNGVARITATSGSATAGIDVTVMQSAGSIVIAPEEATLMSLGETVQLTATVLDGNSQPVAGAVVRWSSGDEAVATVSAQGLVTAAGNGMARITAQSGSASGSSTVTVMQSVASIVIEPEEATLMSLGATVQLTATVLDDNGQPVAGAVVTWTSSDESVATVSAQGLVTAVRNGTARITARSGSASENVDITIRVRVPSPDRDVLIALYNSMDGANWTKSTNWLSDRHVEEWYGVNTDEDSRVTSLNLGGNRLKGLLPIELFHLTSLRGLSLEGNLLSGPIPTELGRLANLTHLYLFDNQLTGSIPPELGQLANLIHLCLNGNVLTGSVPPELARLSNLKWLHLHYNPELTGTLPTAMTVLDLDALLLHGTQVCLTGDPILENWLDGIEDVRLAECDEGQDLERAALEALYTTTNGPNWKNNTNWLSELPLGEWYGVGTNVDGLVTELNLESNGLSGLIPPELGQLANLRTLYLFSNRLRGGILPELGQLANLRTLYLSSNRLQGGIPPELGQLTNLRQLFFKENHLTGSIPPELSQLTNLKQLDLEQNQLTGSIPIELAQLANLTTLDLGKNQLTGGIPSELSRLANLSSLNLDENQLTGGIPVELGQLASLQHLDLGHNPLQGSIPVELGQLDKLSRMTLRYNQLSGSIPAELGQLANLVGLNLSVNGLTGGIPVELGQLTNLELLHLFANRLTGGIPVELGQLTKLKILNLFRNQLSGGIPVELSQLTNLEVLRLYRNPSLTGPLPQEFTRLSSLYSLIIIYTQLCVPSTSDFEAWLLKIEEKYINSCERIVTDRDVLVALYEATDGPNWTNNTNWMSDEPLDQWFGVATNTVGRVEQLILENNNLTGRIPGDLGNLVDLRILTLGDNPSLKGRLPDQLVDLSLEVFLLDGTQLCASGDVEFQSWLDSISQHSMVVPCRFTIISDREVLTKFYHTTDGPNWQNSENWLSDAPLESWYGVRTDQNGRVVELNLNRNNLTGSIIPEFGNLTRLGWLNLLSNNLSGSIPAELGHLTNLIILNFSRNSLSGSIPAELGELSNLSSLNLGSNQLSGSIPAELGNLTLLRGFILSRNQLTGSIPAELGKLANLRDFGLHDNRLTGNIPPELGQVNNPNLTFFNLGWNALTGSIPPELGQLTHLSSELELGPNRLTGSIPAELGKLTNLSVLNLQGNLLTGSIPVELGELKSLQTLWLQINQLSGRIPAKMGQLSELVDLRLRNNQLTGSIPPEIGQLTKVENMALNNNLLTGEVPTEFGNLTNLKALDLSENPGLTGPIPLSMTGLNLFNFTLGGTQICAPSDPEFQTWFQKVGGNSEAAPCHTSFTPEVVVYLTQAAQSPVRPVPLVEGKPAMLRVFLATQEAVSNKPSVRAILYQDGAEVHAVDIPAGPAKIPVQIDESSLDTSGNALVPAEVIRPGLELVVEIDVDGTLGPDSGIVMRIPEKGRMAVDVRRVPPLDLTLVPLLWVEDPDNTVVMQAEGLTRDDDIFRWTRDLLPVKEFQVTVRNPLYTSLEIVESNNELLLAEVQAVRLMDGAEGHYMGIWNVERAGIANIRGFDSISLLDGKIMAHELGHNMSLFHAPCGGPSLVDVFYPYTNGSIGVWGYDLLSGLLLDPSTPDIMGYCFEDAWISDFHFRNSINYRTREEEAPIAAVASSPQTRSMLLWGSLDGDGELGLEPAFVVNAPVSLPREDGPYQLAGEDAAGNMLFTLSFSMSEIADGEGGGFAFTIPVRANWSDRLNRITLSGPEGFVEMTRDSGRSVALLLDQSTGQVRGILRDWPEPGTAVQGARRVVPESGMDVIVSPGIPDPADW